MKLITAADLVTLSEHEVSKRYRRTLTAAFHTMPQSQNQRDLLANVKVYEARLKEIRNCGPNYDGIMAR